MAEVTRLEISDLGTEHASLHINDRKFDFTAVGVKQLAGLVRKLEAHCTQERPHHDGVEVVTPPNW